MNKLTSQKRTQVISCLIEGCSIRSTVRMTGVAKKTVMRLLLEVGEVAARYQDKVFRNLSCKRLQLDELWAFIGAKQKNLTEKNIARGAHGDIWLWIAIDADTKLVPSWMLGNRDSETATVFVADLASRLNNRVQLTTDLPPVIGPLSMLDHTPLQPGGAERNPAVTAGSFPGLATGSPTSCAGEPF